ncbi:9708_t:CDS:2 [Ambispora gerdemannii]|uniref:9708_t:CDS:1 n=1 Tax=Ambispora gerdemannii TaxID=144530 RepID=A0A9N9FDY5_9GLOM|nr:9708_t:CDS:2 [Ambispora gerdemannii]
MKEAIKLMEKIIEAGKNYQPTTENTQSGDKKRKADDEFEVRQEVAKKNKTTGDELSRLIREAQELTNYQELEAKLKEIDKYQGEVAYNEQYLEEINQLKIRLGNLDKDKYGKKVIKEIEDKLTESGIKEKDLDEETKSDLVKIRNGEIKDISKINEIENKIVTKTGDKKSTDSLNKLLEQAKKLVNDIIKGNADYLEKELKKIKKGLYDFQYSSNVYHNKAYQSKEKDVKSMLTKLENYSVQSNTNQPSKDLFRPEIIIPFFLLAVVVVAAIVSSAEKKDITNYLKHYGFLLPNAEIYGGLAKSWDLAECRQCRKRYRLDNLISAEEFTTFLEKGDKSNYLLKVNCRNCGKNSFDPPRQFNLLLTTNLEITEEKENTVYLRPETCQGIFTNFLAIQKSTRRQLPFGIGQIGKSFRNEITLHHGIFRTREFEQMDNSHRGNYDLTQHSQCSGKDFSINGIIPQVIEVSFGVERLMLAILEDSYQKEAIKNSRGEDNEREVLKLPPLLAPYFVAIIPLSKKEKKIAHQLYLDLLPSVHFNLAYEEAPNIGKAYRRQDAIGTYYCLTIDDKTIQDNTITLRYRDTTKQIKLAADFIYDYKSEIGERLITPTAEEVSKLISGNRSRLKTVERVLNDKVKDRKLKPSEKEEVRKELSKVNKELDKTIQEFELEKLEKDDPELLATIYSQFYEQGKVLTRLKVKTSVDRPYEEAMEDEDVLKGETKDGSLSHLDLTQPFQIKFRGYTGFLKPEDSKKSKEGTETFGLTLSEEKVTSRTYHDICFEEVVETIAHELAHAVVNSIRTSYEGEEKGGHGRLFHDLMERIEKMMRKTSEFSDFKDW